MRDFIESQYEKQPQIEYFKDFNIVSTNSFLGLPKQLASVLPPHDYSIPSKQTFFEFKLNQVSLSVGALFFSSWSRGTTVFSYNFETYIAVILLDGIEEFQTPTGCTKWSRGQGAIFNPDGNFTRTALTDCSHLTLSLDPLAINKRACQLLGRKLSDPIIFDTPINLTSNEGILISQTIQFVAKQLERVKLLSQQEIQHDLEQLLIDTILYCQDHTHLKWLERGYECLGPKYVTDVEEYIETNCSEKISLDDLASIAGVGIRALNASFRKYRGTTPMQYLKSVRLNNVRQELLNATQSDRIVDIAMRWGFFQLGWFSAEYKKAFGELPSDTLRRVNKLS